MSATTDTRTSSSSFHLEKWYLDLVTAEGEAFIFYVARMKWRSMIIPYKSWMHIPVYGEPVQRSGIRSVRFPELRDGELVWEDKGFNTKGTWMARGASLNERLFQTASGELQWNCVQPISRVQLVHNGQATTGWGYAEKLVLSVEPWKMPVRRLQWGRYCSENQQLTWIEIENDSTQQWVWYNGEKAEGATITAAKVEIPGKGLVLECCNSRRAGTISALQRVLQKLFRFIPGFRRSVPGKFLSSADEKWVSEGRLHVGNEMISKGWVIHEQVYFNQ